MPWKETSLMSERMRFPSAMHEALLNSEMWRAAAHVGGNVESSRERGGWRAAKSGLSK
jgi:hypothetical protein